jgi:hypothetical protein
MTTSIPDPIRLDNAGQIAAAVALVLTTGKRQ